MKFLTACFIVFLPIMANATDKFRATQELLQSFTNPSTTCSTELFADALYRNSHQILEISSTHDVKTWIYNTIQSPEVLRAVLECPEFSETDDNETIRFTPITYTFPGGRSVSVNYRTQPKILKQIMSLSQKKLKPTSNPNPKISIDDLNANWIYTEPAWYAIMVTKPGALSDFVGSNKNNVISQQYIKDNAKKLSPTCTLNQYYLSDMADTPGIDYNELAAILALSAANSSANISQSYNTLNTIKKNILRLSKFDDVAWYIKAEQKLASIAERNNSLNTLHTILQTEEQLVKEIQNTIRGSAKYESLSNELKTIRTNKEKYIKSIGSDYQNTDTTYLNTIAKNDFQTATELRKKMDKLKHESKNVQQYTTQLSAYQETVKYSIAFFETSKPKHAHPITTMTNISQINIGIDNEKIRNFLFNNTQKHISRMGHTISYSGAMGNPISFIEPNKKHLMFQPQLLLSSATTQGTWLMWVGSSTTPEEDNDAYIQATNFAQTFTKDLNNLCDIDVYVVRPIIRNFETNHQNLYWLIVSDFSRDAAR